MRSSPSSQTEFEFTNFLFDLRVFLQNKFYMKIPQMWKGIIGKFIACVIE